MKENWKKWMEKEKIKSLYESWDFGLFKICCSKCNSFDIGINGEAELTTGYYSSPESDGTILVKCHNCGNAMRIQLDGRWSLDSQDTSKVNSEKKQ
jgi:RNase P subunit RPR2